MKDRDLIRNETTTCTKTDAQMVKDGADDPTRNETSASAKGGAWMVKDGVDDLNRNETTTRAKTGAKKTGAHKCSRQPAITCTTFAPRSNSQIAGPATSLPSVLGAILR